MAYCVHCGVKLGDAEMKCPLCGTGVSDPAEPRDPNVPKPFPVRTPEQTLRINHRYAVSVLSVLLLAPAAVCLLLDILSGGITWSIYPAGVLALCWTAVMVPLMMRKHRTYSTILITGAALAGYLYLVEHVSNSPGWFLPIVLPSLATFLLMVCFTIALVRKWKVPKGTVIASTLAEGGILCFVIELLCTEYGVGVAFGWSTYVMAPCFCLALLFIVISRNRPLSEELRRRLHF